MRAADPGVPGALADGVLDPQGWLWFRAGTAAIVRFDGLSRRWERTSKGLGLPSNSVLALLEASDGRLWAGTENGVYAYPAGGDGEPEVYRSVGGVALRSVTGLAEDRSGKVWISSSEAFAGTFFFENGSWSRFDQPDPGEDPDRAIGARPSGAS